MNDLTDKQDKLAKHLEPSRLDLNNPDKPQTPVDAAKVLDTDEDENTVAKSIVDEIIEETERDSEITLPDLAESESLHTTFHTPR